jgi:hypothetical protein
MIDLEREKKNFQNHVATFTDYGNIKILDFQRPDSNEYRIRFLFEEDHYRLHISGDLGELIAFNYKNMVFELFEEDFTNNTGYFSEKIDCMNRARYYYDVEQAREDIYEYMMEHGFNGDECQVDEFIDDSLVDFDDESGISDAGYDVLKDYYPEVWEEVSDFGKMSTGILDLYMLAFKLAMKQLRERNEL